VREVMMFLRSVRRGGMRGGQVSNQRDEGKDLCHPQRRNRFPFGQ
jgi:hypothetical protein